MTMHRRPNLRQVDALVITLLDNCVDLRRRMGDQYAPFSRDLQLALQNLDGPASAEVYAAKGEALVAVLGRYSFAQKLLAEVSAPPGATPYAGFRLAILLPIPVHSRRVGCPQRLQGQMWPPVRQLEHVARSQSLHTIRSMPLCE